MTKYIYTNKGYIGLINRKSHNLNFNWRVNVKKIDHKHLLDVRNILPFNFFKNKSSRQRYFVLENRQVRL